MDLLKILEDIKDDVISISVESHTGGLDDKQEALDTIDKAIKQVKDNFALDYVNQRSELLVDFWMNLPRANKNKNVAKHYVDKYLKPTNCG